MKKLLCVLALLSAIVSFAQVQVEVKDEQPNNQAMLGLRVRVVNNSGQAYNNVTVQYHLKKSASETFALDPYYTGNWSFSISEQSGENVVVSINIPHLPTGVAPDQSGYSVGIHRTDWQAMVKSTERGFPLGSTFAQALDYAVFQGNTLIGGNAYIDPNSVDPSLRFVGLQPTPYGDIPSWIEIENYGTTPADLSNITLEWATSTGETSSSAVSNAVLEPGKRLRICPTQLGCPDDDLVAAVPLMQDVQGEVLLRYNTTIMDYLSWNNNAGVLAADAREANVQYTRIRHDYGLYDEYWNQVTNDIFYKKIDGTWYSYKTNEYDINITDRPGPIAYSNSEELCLEGSNVQNRMVRFAWHPVEGAVRYDLMVKRSDGHVVFNQKIQQVHQDLVLGVGSYQWSVRVEFLNDNYVVNNPWIDHYTIWKTKTVSRCDNIRDQHYLQVPQYGVHKDTRMLVLNWGELAEFPEISWDHPDIFVFNSEYDFGNYPWYANNLFLEIDNRCWAVSVQILNAYYGGNLTQDEIKYFGKTVGFENVKTVYGTHTRLEREKILSPFVLGGNSVGYPAEVKMTLKWALNIEDSQLEHGCFPGPEAPYCGASFNENFVKHHINAGRPIYYLENGHIMTVDGYRYSGDNFQVHRVNVKNGGEVEWTNNSNIAVNYYFVPKYVTNPRMTDWRVHNDSDGDGIVDFDEIERFHSNPYNEHSDLDGIEDKVEIFSYTIKEPLYKNVQVPVPGGGYETIYNVSLGAYRYEHYDSEGELNRYPFGDVLRFELFADIDNDGFRAEMDVDSDHPSNDGLWDGDEDLNHNGYVDHNETDPYNIADDYATNFNPVENTLWDAPSLVGIYAFEGINVGDGVTCNSGMHGFCQVASEYDVPYHSISVGANSTIGDVFSKGGVQLRDNAHVVGNASIYSLPMGALSPNVGSNASVTGTTSVHNVGEWPYVVSDNLHHSLIGKENWTELFVESGQTITLNPNISYKNLTVRPGGTLKLGAGTIHVGNISLESGSKVEFLNPGRETVIIADGSLNWSAQIVNSDLQTVAKGFKLIEYAPGNIHIEGNWAGTIHARWCDLALERIQRNAYGSFVAKKIYLGNGLTIYRVHFSPIPLTDMV